MFKRDGKFHKRWFVLKGNLLFYFEKKGDKEVLGMLLLEGCTVELSAEENDQQYCFSLNFVYPSEDRSYYLATLDQMTLESWMKAITCASYEYVRIMVTELQRQLEEIDNRNNKNQTALKNESVPSRPPRQRQNPFNKPSSHSSTLTTTSAGNKFLYTFCIFNCSFTLSVFPSLSFNFCNNKIYFFIVLLFVNCFT